MTLVADGVISQSLADRLRAASYWTPDDEVVFESRENVETSGTGHASTEPIENQEDEQAAKVCWLIDSGIANPCSDRDFNTNE